MPFFNRLTAVLLSVALIGPVMPIQARTRKGDKPFAQGRVFEQRKDWDNALDSYRKALAEDPSDIQYQMATQKARFQASQAHVENGEKIRGQGFLGDAMLEFQRAFAIDPGSTIAVQEIRTTQDMIERERQRVMQTGKESSPAERALTPLQQLQKQTDERLDRILPVPELKPLGSKRFDLTIKSNIPKTLFETLGAFAGINVLWDSEYVTNTQPIRNGAVNFQNSTLDEALDYLAVLTKSFWKPLSSNTIFVTMDSRAKRNEFADQVLKVFYLSNVQNTQELQEIVNAVRTVTETQRMFAFTGQNAIVARGEADQVALAEKIIHDLDRPKAEVVVDIIVMETSSNYSRQLAAALAPTGLNVPANFTPRNGLQVVANPGTAATGTTGATTTPAATTTTTTGTALPLANLGHLASSDWSTTLPSALLQAVMSDADTKILQAPQVRSLDNQKASLKIGNKQPTASGSFGSALGLSGAGVSPLVNTQFQYLDVGVNVDLLPRVHDNGDVSLHVELDISSVNGSVDLGGISQPIISQKKVTNDIRLREGEVNLLGGLINVQDTKTTTGIPGLSRIPLLRRLFTGESVTRQRSELMIALVPHIVRRPVFSAENLRTIDVGTATTIHLSYAPKADEEASTPAGQAMPEAATVLTPVPDRVAAPPPATPETALAAPSPVAFPPAPGAPPGLPLPLQQLMRPMPGTAPDATTPPVNATTHFEPARFDTSANGIFTAALVLDAGADVVSASPLQIQYDPKLLRLMDVSPGDLFSRDGAQPVFARDIQNDQGLATIQIGRAPGATGVNAPGTLITLRFQAIAPGDTTVGVLNVTVRNSQARAIGSSAPQLAVSIK